MPWPVHHGAPALLSTAPRATLPFAQHAALSLAVVSLPASITPYSLCPTVPSFPYSLRGWRFLLRVSASIWLTQRGPLWSPIYRMPPFISTCDCVLFISFLACIKTCNYFIIYLITVLHLAWIVNAKGAEVIFFPMYFTSLIWQVLNKYLWIKLVN